MNEAARLVRAGAPHGTIVIAEEQTAGLGRLGRTWESEQELGLYISVLLRLPLDPSRLPIASLLVAVSVAEGIQKSNDLQCDLRWPNDVLIGDRKVAGILPHLVDGCIVAGIGINVNQESFGPNLRTPAGSLRLALGKAVSREDVLIAVVESLDDLSSQLIAEGPAVILNLFQNLSSYVVHRRVRVEDSGLLGTTAGLDTNGFLLVRTDTGAIERITSGGVRPVA